MRPSRFLYIIICLLLLRPAFTQEQKTKKQTPQKNTQVRQLPNSLLWEISGNGLKQPSYMYGTYHLLNDSYLESVPAVKDRFKASQGVVVETELDSAAMVKMGSHMVMQYNKVSALLSAEDYALVSN